MYDELFTLRACNKEHGMGGQACRMRCKNDTHHTMNPEHFAVCCWRFVSRIFIYGSYKKQKTTTCTLMIIRGLALAHRHSSSSSKQHHYKSPDPKHSHIRANKIDGAVDSFLLLPPHLPSQSAVVDSQLEISRHIV